jgi:lipid-A-disaccharide synthase-like uncharacterized protein
MNDFLHEHLWKDGHFRWWEIVGWTGNLIFSTRFFLQWYATEKKKAVVIPAAFWWLSLVGSLLLLAYALLMEKRNWVFIIAYAFSWIPYLRNIIIHNRNADAQLTCAQCKTLCPPHSTYCFACGARLEK